MSFSGSVAIVGIGESEIGRVPHLSSLGLIAQASKRALDDAGLKPAEIDGLLTTYSLTEPYLMYGGVVAEFLGLKPRHCASMVVGGGTPAIMLLHAAAAIYAGLASVILVCSGENRATGGDQIAMRGALSSAVGHPSYERPYGISIPGAYAMVTKRYMQKYGLEREDLALVPVTTRQHASLHPLSHMKDLITVEDVLKSREIASPLNLLDCCSFSDGGGAFIVTSAARAKDLNRKPVYLLGGGEHHTHEHLVFAESIEHFGSRESGRLAFQMAGVTPADIDVAELYDCFSIVPILELEELGFCNPGEGGIFYRQGRASIGGEMPVNTHGGMLSHAHAGPAGGLFAIVEAVAQLRGGLGKRQVQDAELALVHNEGGILSSHCTVILANERHA